MQELARYYFSWLPGFLILIPLHLAELLQETKTLG